MTIDAHALAAAHISDFLTADGGTRWWLLDGRLVSTGSAESLRDGALLVAKSPGLGNLDGMWWTQGMTQDDEGIYSLDGEEIGDLAAVVRHSCEEGDVTSFVDELATKITEAVIEADALTAASRSRAAYDTETGADVTEEAAALLD